MRLITYTLLIIFILSSLDMPAQSVRIMPMGNSITYDHNSLDDSNPRPIGDRISYRYKLYQLLTNEGLDFDLVGSEDAGNNYFQNSQFDDNAGFPGIESWELADLINTGYNNYSHQYVSPGPYLNYYPTDIILLHIGTNNLITSAYQVEDILDNIRYHDNDVIILVARIVNRKSYHPETTTFNNNVELMVNSRGDNRIRMVNIETGAGINYAVDMIDNLHPNQAGYDKIAVKWFDEILKLNKAPVISFIPDQQISKGETFPDLNLDQYVSDEEDPDFKLVWTYEKSPDSRLTISIDASRILHITPDPDWSGIETVKLRVKDTGSGAFIQHDSTEVVFQVEHVNSPPEIISTPNTNIMQGDSYLYTIIANDVDEDSLIYAIQERPSWLNFNASLHTLNGVPEHSDVGVHHVILSVSDGTESVEQEFQIHVEDANDPPVVTSQSSVEVYQDDFLNFQIKANDLDGDYLIYSVLNKPAWLSFSSTLHILSGKPTNDEVGIYDLTVKVSDGIVDVYEPLQIIVVNVNDLPVITSAPQTTVEIGESYIYRITASDIDADDILTFSILAKPEWLNFTTSSTDALLYGKPSDSDFGSSLVIIEVSDGYDDVVQAFNLKVIFATGEDQIKQNMIQRVYPNPATTLIHFDLNGLERATIYIYDNTGILYSVHNVEDNHIKGIDISDLPSGFYIYKVYRNGIENVGKFIKR